MITAADIQMIRNNDPGAVLPGIDTMTGNPYATSTLLDVTKITQNSKAPYYYSPSNKHRVRQAGRRGAQRHQFWHATVISALTMSRSRTARSPARPVFGQ